MSERELIKWIRQRLVASPYVLVHSGDDLAVLRTACGDLVAFGTDTIVAGVDFNGPDADSPTPASAVGRKAAAVNLSDLAAMGAKPMACTASVILPPGLDMEYAQGLYEGIADEAAKWGMPVVGGDITAAEAPLAVTAAVLGTYEQGDKPLLRSAAEPDDALLVTGPLGGSILGKHLDFEPRVRAGRFLSSSGLRVACIDISDGISVDAGHLAEESGVRIVVEADRLPVSASADRLASQDGRPALEHALHDGEDYELLFTVPADAVEGLLASWPEEEEKPCVVGRVEAAVDGTEARVLLEKNGALTPLQPGGYEHQF